MDESNRLAEICQAQIIKWFTKYCNEWNQENVTSNCTSPFIIAITGPQGSGKSTLVQHLIKSLNSFEVREDSSGRYLHVIGFSLDDFYLTYGQQRDLAKTYPENDLWKSRGNPGTHDVDLLQGVFEKLKSHNAASSSRVLSIPSYNKYLNDGAGDRTSPEHCQIVEKKPIDMVLFEGWMNTFKPLSYWELDRLLDEKQSIYNGVPLRYLFNHKREHLLQLNDALNQFYTMIRSNLNASIVICTNSVHESVFKWRKEAELTNYLKSENDKQFKSHKPMDSTPLNAFIERFMPAYELYYGRAMHEDYFEDHDSSQQLLVTIDSNRTVTSNFFECKNGEC